MFGIIAMLAGLIGVPLGSYLVQRLRPTNPKCDGMVCAWGLFISAPLVYASLVVAPYNGSWCYILVFCAQISLNLCWSIVADILLVRRQRFWFFMPQIVCGTYVRPSGDYLGVYGIAQQFIPISFTLVPFLFLCKMLNLLIGSVSDVVMI